MEKSSLGINSFTVQIYKNCVKFAFFEGHPPTPYVSFSYYYYTTYTTPSSSIVDVTARCQQLPVKLVAANFSKNNTYGGRGCL